MKTHKVITQTTKTEHYMSVGELEADLRRRFATHDMDQITVKWDDYSQGGIRGVSIIITREKMVSEEGSL